MTPFLGLILILLVVFIGTRFYDRNTVLRKSLFSGIIISGIPYILFGVLLGPRIFNFLSPEIINSLKPLISLALGWVGLLLGIQFRWRNIRRFPVNYFLFTSLQSLISFFIIFLILFGALWYLSPANFTNRLEAAIVLAAIGSITAPLTLARIIIEHKAKGRLTHFLQFISSIDDVWGITIIGIAMAIFHPYKNGIVDGVWQWILLSLVLSISLGFLFRYLLQVRFNQQEIFLLVLGLVIFTSGIGFYLKLSPIFLNMIVGMTLAQFRRESEKVIRVILMAEKPIYLLLLVFAGSLWNYQFLTEILLIIIFIIGRFLGKYAGGWLSAKKIDCAFSVPTDIGKALLSFGGTSLAIAFNFQLFFGGSTGDFLMSATIFGVFLFDEFTAIHAVKILKRQGEIQ